MERDPLIGFRTVIRGMNKKGGDRIQLYLDPEKVGEFIQTLSALAESPKGVKLDLHISKKTNTETGHQFDSAFAFVKAVSEGRATGGGPKKVVTKASTADVAAKIEGFKKKQIEG